MVKCNIVKLAKWRIYVMSARCKITAKTCFEEEIVHKNEMKIIILDSSFIILFYPKRDVLSQNDNLIKYQVCSKVYVLPNLKCKH